jgi:hypothetical protein
VPAPSLTGFFASAVTTSSRISIRINSAAPKVRHMPFVSYACGTYVVTVSHTNPHLCTALATEFS